MLAYLCISVAGVLLLVSPSVHASLGLIGVIMSGFLALGAFLGMAGQVFNRWIGEYVGLPLVSSAFAVFGVITFRGNLDVAPVIAYANLALLSGIAFSLLARWRQVRAVYRLALHLSPMEE